MRRTELDLCRIFACLSVLIIHTNAEFYWDVPLESFDFAFINFFASSVRGSVPLFFMISGSLFFNRDTLDVKRSIIPHTLRLIGLFFFWSSIYACGKLALGQIDSINSFLSTIVSGHYHLWFLPTMALCYLFFPPVYFAINGKKLKTTYILWLFLILGILFKSFVFSPIPVPNLLRFSQHFNMDQLPYLGYAIWGAWLDSKRLPNQLRWLAPLAFLFVSIIAAVGNRWFSLSKGVADGWLFFDFFL